MTAVQGGRPIAAGLLTLSLAASLAGCTRAPAPSVSTAQSLSPSCLAVTSITVRSLGPPSPRPALLITDGQATGRTGGYGGFHYPMATLSAPDWKQLQRAGCAEQTYYGAGATTIDSGSSVGGQVFVNIATAQGTTDLSFGGPTDSSKDPLLGALRVVATKYFGSVTF